MNLAVSTAGLPFPNEMLVQIQPASLKAFCLGRQQLRADLVEKKAVKKKQVAVSCWLSASGRQPFTRRGSSIVEHIGFQPNDLA